MNIERWTGVVCLLTAALFAGCGEDEVLDGMGGGGAADQGVAPDAEPLPAPEVDGLAAPALTLDPFAVAIDASSGAAAPGAAFTFEARITRVDAPDVRFEWDVGDGQAGALDGPTVQVSFAAAGAHDVRVTVTDEDGAAVVAGATVFVFADDPGRRIGDVNGDGALDAADRAAVDGVFAAESALSADGFDRADIDRSGRLDAADRALLDAAIEDGRGPRVVLPAAGALGRKLQLITPALFDPAATITVRVGDGAPQVPARPEPGYALLTVPPDVGPAGASTVIVEADGVEVQRFDFEVLPTPAASAAPGARVIEALAAVQELATALPEVVDRSLVTLEADDTERAIVAGMLRVSLASFENHRAAFEEAFARMEPEGRAAFEQVALANDLDAVLAEIDGLRAELQRLGVARGSLRADLRAEGLIGVQRQALNAAQGAVLLDTLCAAQGIADVASKVAEINEIAAGFIDAFDFFPVNILPGVGQVIRFLSGISAAIGAITDVIAVVAEFLPEFGELQVEASAAVLLVGESATVSASIEIISLTKLCGKAADAAIGGLIETIQDTLTVRLARAIPFVGQAFRRRDFDRENAGFLTGLVFDVVGEISGAVIDALGIEEGLQSLAEKICGLLDDPNVPLGDEVLSSSCGSVAGGRFTCSEACLGSVTFSGETTICGEQRQGQTSIRCEEENQGGGECSCDTAGATLSATPEEGGGCFEDSEQCSGWASAVIVEVFDNDFSEENERAAVSEPFPDGTEICAFGCCITLSCP